MKKSTLVILILITFLGAFLRLYKLDKFPPALFGDEVDVGYQAYSILKTGKDYLGQPWPISFHSLADWRTPLYLYADVPFIAFFGMNEWGVRLPAALFGIFTIPMFFLLVNKLFKNERVALFSAFLITVSMWHLQFSRAAFEVSQMLFLLITGLYFFLIGLKKRKYLTLSAIFLALTPYSYNTAKFFLPLFSLILLFCYWDEIKNYSFKKLLVPLFLFVIFLLPMGYDIFFGQGGNRFSILSVFSDPTVSPQIGFDRQVDSYVSLGNELKPGAVPLFSSRVFHNKLLYWAISLMKNYFDVFSTSFLFTRGDMNLRHSIQSGFGELYWTDAIFLLVGIVFLVLRIKNKALKKFIIFWVITAPIPSVLTREGGYHATRLILLLPPVLILISLGVNEVINLLLKKKIALVFLGVVFVFQLSLYLHNYYTHYPLVSEGWWQYGYKEIALYAKENKDKYDYVIFNDKNEPPLIFSLFWTQTDPKFLQENKNKLVPTIISDAITANNLPGTNFYYGHISDQRIIANGIIGTLKPYTLYLVSKVEVRKDFKAEPVPPSINLLKMIYYPSGAISHYVLTGM